MERFNTITRIVDTGLITSTVITGGVSIPVGVTLSGTSLLISLAKVVAPKSFETFYHKARKTRCH